MIMWASSHYLLEQKFGEDAGFFPSGKDTDLKERIIWWLRTKIAVGFYEFYSHVYMRFTLGSLLNLYDFVEDDVIKSLTEQCLIRFFEELAECYNSLGYCISVSARDQLEHYMSEKVIFSPEYRIANIFLGLGKFEKLDDGLEFAVAALAYSNISLVPAMRRFG